VENTTRSAASLGPWPWPGTALSIDDSGFEAAAAALCPTATPLDAPWSMWTRALALRLGLTQCDELGLAVALIGVRGPLEASALATVRALEIASADTLLDAVIASRGSGGPAALALGLPCALAGNPLPVEALAALSCLGDLLEGRVAVTLDPDDAAIRHSTPNALLASLLADPVVGPDLRLALAGRRQAIGRRLEITTLLAGPAARQAEARVWEDALGAARRISGPPAVHDWVEAMAHGGKFIHAAATFRGLAASVRPRCSPPDAQALDRTEAAAAAFLQRPGALQSTWEVQRWGVAEHAEPLYSRWFQEGIALQALHEAGRDQSDKLSALLRSLQDELRWYVPDATAEAPAWRGIPPDADSLGLMLQISCLAPGLDPVQARGWLAYLHASLPTDLRLPTWFYVAPGGGSSIDGAQWEYASNDCTSARLTCLTGLLLTETPGSNAVLAANLDVVSRCFRAGADTGDFFYTRETAEFYFLRFAHHWRHRRPTHAATPSLTKLAVELANRIAGRQGLDGGWGSAHASALQLDALALWPTAAGPLRRGIRFLEEAQRPDGAWYPSPFYLMPGKSLQHIEYLSSYEVTTALCLRAVHRARASLEALDVERTRRNEEEKEPVEPPDR
jgi:hypothetical protein